MISILTLLSWFKETKKNPKKQVETSLKWFKDNLFKVSY